MMLPTSSDNIKASPPKGLKEMFNMQNQHTPTMTALFTGNKWQSVVSSDSEDEVVLPTIREMTTTTNNNLASRHDDGKPWDTNVPYKFEKVNKGGKQKRENMDEEALREYIIKSTKKMGMIPILKKKRKRLYGGKDENKRQKREEDSSADDEPEKRQDFWPEDEEYDDEYCDGYETDSDDTDEEREDNRWKVSASYDSSMEDRLL